MGREREERGKRRGRRYGERGENERSEPGRLKSGGGEKVKGEGYKCLNFKIGLLF